MMQISPVSESDKPLFSQCNSDLHGELCSCFIDVSFTDVHSTVPKCFADFYASSKSNPLIINCHQ